MKLAKRTQFKVEIQLENLPEGKRYQSVFCHINGSVRVHQHRVQLMTKQDFNPPLSGVWSRSNVFQLSPASVRAYLKGKISSAAGTRSALPSATTRRCTSPQSNEFIEHASLPRVVENRGCEVSSFGRNAVPPSVSAMNLQMPAAVTGNQGYAVPPSVSPMNLQTPAVTGNQGYAVPPSVSAMNLQTPVVTGNQGYAVPPSVSAMNLQTPVVTGKQGYALPPSVSPMNLQTAAVTCDRSYALPPSVSPMNLQTPTVTGNQGYALPPSVSPMNLPTAAATGDRSHALPPSVSPLNLQAPAVMCNRFYDLSSGRNALPPGASPPNLQAPPGTFIQEYALPPSVSALNLQAPPVTGHQGISLPPSVANLLEKLISVKQETAGKLTPVEKQSQLTELREAAREAARLLVPARNASQAPVYDSASHHRTSTSSQPSAMPRSSLNHPLHPSNTDFSVPPPPVIAACGRLTLDGASVAASLHRPHLRPVPVMRRHSPSGNVKERKNTPSATVQGENIDTKDMSQSYGDDTWQSFDMHTESDDRCDAKSSNVSCHSSESKWGSRDDKYWGAGTMDDKNWSSGTMDDKNWGACSMDDKNWGSGTMDDKNWGSGTMDDKNWGSGSRDGKNWGSGSMDDKNWGSGSMDDKNWGAGSMDDKNWGSDSRDDKNWGAGSRDDKNWGAGSRDDKNRGAGSMDDKNWGAGSKSVESWGADNSGDKNWGKTSWETTSGGNESRGPASGVDNNWTANTSGYRNFDVNSLGTNVGVDKSWGAYSNTDKSKTTDRVNMSRGVTSRRGTDTYNEGSYSGMDHGGNYPSEIVNVSSYPGANHGVNRNEIGNISAGWGVSVDTGVGQRRLPLTPVGGGISSRGDSGNYPAATTVTRDRLSNSYYPPTTSWGADASNLDKDAANQADDGDTWNTYMPGTDGRHVTLGADVNTTGTPGARNIYNGTSSLVFILEWTKLVCTPALGVYL